MVEAGDEFLPPEAADPVPGEDSPIVLEEVRGYLNPDGIFDGEGPRFSEPEASTVERAMFNMTCRNLGSGLPLLPWEQGVFAQIFAPELNNGLPDTLSVAPAPAPLVTAEKDPEESEAFIGRTTPGVSTLPLYAKRVRALCDRDLAQNLIWTRAIASWLTILESSRFESRVGW